MIRSVSVIGLGKLGASMAAGMASRGLHVVGVDVSRSAVDAVNQGRAPVQETGLAELVAANRERLRATMSTAEAILGSEISFVIVPTPSDDRGAFSLQYAAHAFREIGRGLAQKRGYHTVVLTSTVLPGSTRQVLLPILERESGKRCGPDFGLCYSPEFIALGTVIRDFLNPDFYLVGQFDERSGDAPVAVNEIVSQNGAANRRMTLENAEIAKVALNSFVTIKISFANTLAELCEKVPGGDVDAVSDALGLDTRIGRKYLTGGLGFGGPCFPRDNVALAFIGRALGGNCELLETNDRFNRDLARRTVARLDALVPPGSTVAVLGLAYKPLSHVIEESQGVMMAKALSDAGRRVIGYDSLAGAAAKTALAYHALVADSLEECLRDAEVVVVTTPDEEFRALTARDILGDKRAVTVIDFWRCLEPTMAGQSRIRYVPIGRCVDDEAASARLRDLWHSAPD